MAGDGVGDRLRRRRSAEAFADDDGEQPLAVTAQGLRRRQRMADRAEIAARDEDRRQGQGFEPVEARRLRRHRAHEAADAFAAAFTAAGGTVAISAAHEDGKADYSAEVAALAASGADMLVVAGYTDQGGRGIIQNSLDTGAFDTFYLPDGSKARSNGELIEAIVAVARVADRECATPAEARQMLHLAA